MYIDLSSESTVYAISIKVTLCELTNTFMGLNSAAAKPGEPSWAAPGTGPGWRLQKCLSSVNRSKQAGYREGGVTFLCSFIHLLITFCQILWGWNLLPGPGPCLPKGKFFAEFLPELLSLSWVNEKKKSSFELVGFSSPVIQNLTQSPKGCSPFSHPHILTHA